MWTVLSGPFASGRTIPSLCILALKVLGWRPRIDAAASFPSMRYRVSERILIILSGSRIVSTILSVYS
jgi:hypothetical protein